MKEPGTQWKLTTFATQRLWGSSHFPNHNEKKIMNRKRNEKKKIDRETLLEAQNFLQ